MIDTIIFPSSYFNKRKVDEDLQLEYDAVINTKLFNVIIFGYNEWFNKEQIVLTNTPTKYTKAIYRGWMMKPEKYDLFYNLLKEYNIELITTPKEYNLMHIFPNAYELIKDDTAKMKIFPLHQDLPIDEIKKDFSKFMIKDYVKSVKGSNFPKYFDDTITQLELNNWMDIFYKYRGDLLTGGICVKEYLNLKKYGSKTNEFRVFYINNKVATISRNSGQINTTIYPPKDLINKYKTLSSCYYTIDFAELDDGNWTIIEVGDGSVSGLSENQDYESYFRNLYYALN
jgi:hypothetical protein